MRIVVSQVDRSVCSECECLHDDLCRFLWSQRDYSYFSSLFFLELDALFEGIFFVGIDDELRFCRVDRLSIRCYFDAGGCVGDPSNADDDLQLLTTFLGGNSGVA